MFDIILNWLEVNTINILLTELIIILSVYRWFDHLVRFLTFLLPLYCAITTVVIKWSLYLGCRSYYVRYVDPFIEPKEEKIIIFPIIWM